MIQINIPMPNNCYDCPFSDDSGDYQYCWVLRGYTFDRRTKRFPNCPLKAVEEKKENTETDKLKDMCRVLFNRCKVVGSADGAMCIWCGIRKCLSNKACSENGCPFENECAVEHRNNPLLRDALTQLKQKDDFETGFFAGFEYGGQIMLKEIIKMLKGMRRYGGDKQAERAD